MRTIRKAQWGGIAIQTLGPIKSEPDWRDLDKFDDTDLVWALGYRGYDVKIKAPTREVLDARKRRHEAEKKRAARKAAKGE